MHREQITVVIVARTHMHEGRVCVGALSERGENLRLLNNGCTPDMDRHCLFHVGEMWQIACSPCGERKPPHVEDVAVSEAEKIGFVENIPEYVLKLAKPWQGGIGDLFERKIRFTQNGAGFVRAGNLPSCSTGFWIPYCDLKLHDDGRGKAAYFALADYRHLSYVGVQAPIEMIEAKTLVRVSLARWWRPTDVNDPLEERCYAQVSAWY